MGIAAVGGIVAGVGALAGAGASVYSANKASSAAGAAGAVPWDTLHKLNSLNLGSVPQAAPYQPVDFSQDQINAIMANQNSLPYLQSLMNGTNSAITNDSLKQINKLVPGYSASMRTMGANANSLLNGHLPINDLQDLITNQGEASNAVNVPGLAGNATLRDLGMSQMQAEQSGSGMLGDMVSMARQVTPSSSYLNPASMMVSPSDRIGLDMSQNQLEQQSQQNANNLAAAPSPNAQAQAQLLIGSALMPAQGNSMGAQLAGLGSSLGNATASIGKAGNTAGWWGNGSTSDGMNNAGYYTSPNSFSSAFPSTDGSTPIMQQNANGYYYGGYTDPSA